MQVLVALQSTFDRKAIELLLLPYGAITYVAADVDVFAVMAKLEALDSRVDLVFLDQDLPVQGGISVLRAIRERESPTGRRIVAFLVGSPSVSGPVLDPDLLVADYLSSPIDEQSLFATLRRHGLIGTLDGTL